MPFTANVSAHPGKVGGSVSFTKAPLDVYINGAKQSFDQPPVVENGRTLVPLRGIFENLGATVQWDTQKQLVTADRSGIKFRMDIGSNLPTVNGLEIPVDVPAKIVNGRTLVPIRYVGETLGATVNYDEGNRTINLTSSN